MSRICPRILSDFPIKPIVNKAKMVIFGRFLEDFRKNERNERCPEDVCANAPYGPRMPKEFACKPVVYNTKCLLNLDF